MNKCVTYDNGKEVVECLLIAINDRHGTVELQDGFFKIVPMKFLKAIQEPLTMGGIGEFNRTIGEDTKTFLAKNHSKNIISKIENKRRMTAGLLLFIIDGKEVYKMRHEIPYSIQIQINKVLVGTLSIKDFNQAEEAKILMELL